MHWCTILPVITLVMLNANTCFSQTSVLTLDTIPSNHLLEVKLTVDSDFSSVDSMKVEMIGIKDEEDTTGLFLGAFNWANPNPSNFYYFSMNDTQTSLTLGLGYFDSQLFEPRVFLYRSGVEELIEN